jgi:hypothetical protein
MDRCMVGGYGQRSLIQSLREMRSEQRAIKAMLYTVWDTLRDCVLLDDIDLDKM